jgi:hypothetical protein
VRSRIQAAACQLVGNFLGGSAYDQADEHALGLGLGLLEQCWANGRTTSVQDAVGYALPDDG